MKNLLYLLILLFCFQIVKAQFAEKVYFSRGHNYSTIYSYYVSELILFNDSTFERHIYKIPNKKEWKNYKKYIPSRFEGKISKGDKFYALTEFINDDKTDIVEFAKITENKISFYLKNGNSYEKIYVMKRKY